MAHEHHHGVECSCCGMNPEIAHEQITSSLTQAGLAIVPGRCKGSDGRDTNLIYTIGLAAMGLPELVITGLPFDRTAWTLDQAARCMTLGNMRLQVRDPRFLDQYDVMFVPVPAKVASGYLELACVRAGGAVDGIQVVWPDAKNRFPWDPLCNEAIRSSQPVLSHTGPGYAQEPPAASDTGPIVPGVKRPPKMIALSDVAIVLFGGQIAANRTGAKGKLPNPSMLN